LSLAAACGGNGDSVGGNDESSSGPALTSSSDDATTADATTADATTADDGATSSGGGVCVDEQPAIVTDIDETLTLSDEEFFMQAMDPTYDPIERDGGSEMITAYADLGYRIMYLTARSENFDIADSDETAREITVRWLEEHGYPLDPETTVVVLAETLVVGDATQMYKSAALMDQQALGWRFDYAYGNATTDIGAYADAGIDKAATFIIGEEAGVDGTVPIDGEGWVDHTAEQLPTVPAVCEAA
jgi:hypothetical protein